MSASQNRSILTWLRKGKSITPLDAEVRFGSRRLAARIYDLRDAGYGITSEMVKVRTRSGTARVAQYRLK